MIGKTFKKGGVHPPECKLTAHDLIVDVELPLEVILSVAQQIGAPSATIVAKGDTVKRGQLVAKAGGFVSANLHTPITGTVTKIDKSKNAYGFLVDAITITATKEQHDEDIKSISEGETPKSVADLDNITADQIKAIVSDAGIVGLGGATFPTKVKLSPPPGAKADVLIVNGAECEPYLTCDQSLMMASAAEIVQGIRLTMRAANVTRALVGIELNKLDAIEAMRAAAAPYSEIEVVPLKVKYPQGGEKQLICALTGRQVPSGQLPVSVGAIVQNVATIFAIYQAVACGKPLIDRVVTVTGPSVKSPGNFRVPLGYPIRALVDKVGGVPSDTGKIILGGPMMGKAIVNIDAPTIKGVSGVLMMPEDQAQRVKISPCIRCGKCVAACPMGLQPTLLASFSRLERWDDAESDGVTDCMECGSCQFICPAGRPLLDLIRVGKNKVTAIMRARAK